MSFCTVHDFLCGIDHHPLFEVCVLGRVSDGFVVRGGTTENRFPPTFEKIVRARDTSQQSLKRDSLTQQMQVFRKSQELKNWEAIQCERPSTCRLHVSQVVARSTL